MANSQDRINGLLGDLGVKAPVRVATTAAITLYGEQTIDGVAVVAEDRVLVKDQSDQTTNGIYYCQATAWVRAPDFDGPRDCLQGTLTFVTSGTVNAGTLWQLTSTSPVITTSNLVFALVTGITASTFIQTLLDDADASTALTTLGFSSFIKTLLDDTDAATARATLGAVGLTGNENVAGVKTFTSGAPILGTATNDNAATGYIGQYLSSTVLAASPVSLTSGTPANITSLALTPGDWQIDAQVGWVFGASTSVTALTGSVSGTSATTNNVTGFQFRCAAFVPGATQFALAVPGIRITVPAGSPVTYYLVSSHTFTVSTLSGWGFIGARRIR